MRTLDTTIRSAVTVLLVAVGALPVFASPAAAAPAAYAVTSTADVLDAVPGDGRCRTAAGTCTLRAAVTEAFLHPLQPATIDLPAGRFELTRPVGLWPIDLTGPLSGDLVIVSPLTIRGAGARQTVIDGNGNDRIFMVLRPGIDVSMQDMTLTGGVATQRELVAVSGGGAIFNQGNLTLRRMALIGNHAPYGGGLFNAPTSHADVIDSTIAGNTAEAEAAGIRFDAGGTVVNSTIAGNAILDVKCCLGPRFDGSTVGEGGGIDVRGVAGVTILNSTIVGNHAVTGGGGVNRAVGYTGDLGTGLAGDATFGQPLVLRNTIVAGNTSTSGASDCKHTLARIDSGGHNIDSGTSCSFVGPGDLSSMDPLLSTMGDHGGPTDTHLPRAMSPARGGATACPATDQRGRSRPVVCDVGSTEVP